MITLSSKITLRDYIKLNFILVYKKTMSIVILLFGFINMIVFAKYLLYDFNSSEFPLLNFIFGITIVILMPLALYLYSTKFYKSHIAPNGTIDWTINENQIILESQKNTEVLDWGKIQKIHRINNYIIIYKSMNFSYFINNNSFKTNDDYAKFWEYAFNKKIQIK